MDLRHSRTVQGVPIKMLFKIIEKVPHYMTDFTRHEFKVIPYFLIISFGRNLTNFEI